MSNGSGYLTGVPAARGMSATSGPGAAPTQPAFVGAGPVNAWDPYMAACLGLDPSPPVCCSPYSDGLNVSPAPPQPGTVMPAAVALFTPMPAIPGTGPGLDSSLYLNTFGGGSAANQVNWSGRTPRALSG